VTTYTYDAAGNRASVAYPNGTVAEYTYDRLNRLTNLANSAPGGGVISSYVYTLGPAGNRTRVVENTGRTIDYTYDGTYKLAQESINDPVFGLQDISYTYDAVGNRLTKVDNGVTTVYTHDANDRLLTENGITYTYDDNGNTLTKIGDGENVSYSYDYQNRLVRVNDASSGSVIDYAYDVDGIRVQKTVNGTNVANYLVDKNRDYAQVLLETDGTGAAIVSYVHGDDLVSQQRASTLYYHYDGQMSTRQLTDGAALVTDTYVFDAFGILLAQAGATINDYLYSGEQYDPNIGFYYLRARYMDPSIGRFITMDDFPVNIFDPYSIHRYLYVGNDPVNYVDPAGQFGFSLTGFVVTGAIIGAIAGAMIYTYITPPGQRSWKGYILSIGIGAALGAAMGYGGWYLWLAYGPTITATYGGITATISKAVADKWTSVNNLMQHFLKHGRQVSQVIRQYYYTAQMYAADAQYIVETGTRFTNRYGQTCYVRWLGNSINTGRAIMGYVVVNTEGKVITFIPMGLKQIAKYIPGW
jgi:RHS repeat-associated protein